MHYVSEIEWPHVPLVYAPNTIPYHHQSGRMLHFPLSWIYMVRVKAELRSQNHGYKEEDERGEKHSFFTGSLQKKQTRRLLEKLEKWSEERRERSSLTCDSDSRLRSEKTSRRHCCNEEKKRRVYPREFLKSIWINLTHYGIKFTPAHHPRTISRNNWSISLEV